MPDIAAYVAALRGLDGVTDGPIGVTGYCMGARLAVRAATGHPDDVAACGGFHGGGLVTDEPDSPHAGLGSARAEFVFGHADNDGSMPPEAVAALGAALAEHGLDASNEVYPGAPHGYSMADTSMYDEAAAERHFAELEALFARTLRRSVREPGTASTSHRGAPTSVASGRGARRPATAYDGGARATRRSRRRRGGRW